MYAYPTANLITKISLKKFNALPKTGKPTEREWTVLSTIIQFDSTTNVSKVVALGTGTKCIGSTNLCSLGLILNDSHAEIVARRAFLRYIYSQLNGTSEIFSFVEEKKCFQLKECISFHFFSTQIPCGDACIVEEDKSDPPSKRAKLDADEIPKNDEIGQTLNPIYTGAKVLDSNSENPDPMHQKAGAIRIKPGRGVRTLSLSCSDKISKWNVLGIQGALLDSVLKEPIYMKTLNFSCDFNQSAMERAIYGRYDQKIFLNERFQVEIPEIRKSCHNETFAYAQTDKKQPSPTCIYWSDIPESKRPHETGVNGKRQGVNLVTLYWKKSSLRISKALLLDEYCELLQSKAGLLTYFGLDEAELEKITYSKFKALSTDYQHAWQDLQANYFGSWATKHKSLLEFTVMSSYNNK